MFDKQKKKEMAAIRRSLIYSLLSVLLFLLGLTYITKYPWETTGSTSCQCSENTYEGFPCENRTCHTVECYFIDTIEEVDCVAEILNNVSTTMPDFPLNIALMDSDFDVFPDDFFVPYNVLALLLNSNTMPEIPYRLINPVCHGLLDLTVFYGNIRTVPPNGFQNCTALLKMDLSTNGIEDISPEAFMGLFRLRELVIFDNALQTFDGFVGIERLQTLDLSLNKINAVSIDAFLGLGQLKNIDLSRNNLSTLEDGTFETLGDNQVNLKLEGNPFLCDCSLKWLKDWTVGHDVDNQTFCNAPVQGYLVDMDYLDYCGSTTTDIVPKC